MDKTKFQNSELINMIRQNILDYVPDIEQEWGYEHYKDITDWKGLKPTFDEFILGIDEIATRIKGYSDMIACIYICKDDAIANCEIIEDPETLDYLLRYEVDNYDKLNFNNLYIVWD